MIVRYLRLLLAQLQASALVAAQYRADFLIDGLIELLWTATALAPLLVIYDHRASVAGWSFGEALIVVGFFTLLQALLEGIIQPSFVGVMEQIRDGTFDFVLLKPADAQFLSSTSRLSPWRSINLGTAGVLFCVAFRALGRTPAIGDLGLTVIAAGAAMTMLYSLWILLLCLAFRSARLEELTDLFTAVFDAARWPSSIFRGALRLVFTAIIPLAVMTTVPARALLGIADTQTVAGAVGGALLFSIVARRVWLGSLAAYTSASS